MHASYFIGNSPAHNIVAFTAAIFSGNERSASCLRKVGFQFDRHIEGAYTKNGVIINADMYIYNVGGNEN